VARDLWNAFGANDIIDDVLQVDRSGPGVLEVLIRRQDNSLLDFNEFGIKEVLVIGCWYLWWLRRRRTHEEEFP
jgi:hypothetical protein